MTRKGSSTMTDAKALVRHARKLREELNEELPNGVGNTIDALCDALEQSDAVMGEAMWGHDYWGAGEPDCPREIKAGNGELRKLRCKVCGLDNPRDDRCFPEPSSIAPVQDDDAEWLLTMLPHSLVMGTKQEVLQRLEAIASRLSRQAGG